MRERVTFVHPPGLNLDPKSLELHDVGLLGPTIKAIREDRITITLDELPTEIAELLSHTYELHLRWASPLAQETLDPFGSRLSPGLHVFIKSSREDASDASKLCTLLHLFGPVDCTSSDAFTTSGRAKIGDPVGLYFYHLAEDLRPFAASVISAFCPDADSICHTRLRALHGAASLDISFDATSQQLRLSSLTPLREQPLNVPGSSKRRTEIGILGKDVPPSLESHEIGLSGFLAVLGEQDEPSPTIFSFPAKHRLSYASFSSKFLTPTGLHPTLQLALSSSKPPVEDAGCAPYAYLTLPKTIFADRYQLDDELFLASKNLTASRYTSLPVDLEAPAYTTPTWGSNVLLQLAPPSAGDSQTWTAEVPLHLRYLEPSATGEVQTEVPYPVVFWACESEAGVKFANNPFDRTRLGYDDLFSSTTAFWHVNAKPESGDRIMNPITVPVLKDEGSQLIRLGTAAAVTLGFVWVLWKLMASSLKTDGDISKNKKVEDKKTK